MAIPIQITALHDLELTDGIKTHVNSKFNKLEKHFSQIMDAHVTLSVDKKFLQTAKANLSLAAGGKVIASHTSDDLYASIDLLIDKLDEQIRAHKEKLKDRD